MPHKTIIKLLLVLAIPLLLAWAISSISSGSNLYFFQITGFLILIIFGIYAAVKVLLKFNRSIQIASKEKSIAKKLFILAVFFLLLAVILIGIDKFFETAFKFIGT